MTYEKELGEQSDCLEIDELPLQDGLLRDGVGAVHPALPREAATTRRIRLLPD